MHQSRRISSKRIWQATVLVSVALGAVSAHGAWIGTTTGLNYLDTPNWAGGGTIDDSFSNNLSLDQTIYLGSDRTTSGNSTAGPNGAAYTNGLTFTYGDSHKVTILPSGSTSRTVALNGNVLVDVAGATVGQTVTLGSLSQTINIDLNGSTRTFMVSTPGQTGQSQQWSNQDLLHVYGDISNGTLIKDGWGTLQLHKPVSLTTPLDIKRGRVQISDTASLGSVSSVQLDSMWSMLSMDAASNTRVNDAAPITFRSGMLLLKGQSTAYSETLGAVTLESGKANIGIDSGTSSTSQVTLTLTSLTRQNSAMLSVNGMATLGGLSKILVSDATSNAMLANSLVGGGGSATSTNISILPWAVFSIASSGQQDNSGYNVGKASGTVGGFVTYDSTNGFRPLNMTTEYTSSLAAAGSTDNVHLTAGEALSANKTINALWSDPTAASTITLNNNSTLTVTSGAIAGSGYDLTITGGTLAFGDKPGYFTSRNNIYTYSAITGTAGIVVGGPNVVILGGNNTYTGDTVVLSGGVLRTLGSNDRIPDSSNVYIANEGRLVIGYEGTSRNEVIASLSGRGTMGWGNGNRSSLRLGMSSTTVSGTVAVGIGGFISPGDNEGTMRAGTLTLGDSTYAVNAVFESGSSLKVDLASGGRCDVLALVNGNANITGGTINVSYLNGYVPTVGDTFTILTTTGGIAGGFTSVGDGSGTVFSQSIVGNNLQLQIVSVPEPEAIMLMSAAVGMLAVRRRSRAR